MRIFNPNALIQGFSSLLKRDKKGKIKALALLDNKEAFKEFDMLYQLSYMSVIAAAGVPRARIFEKAAEAPCATAAYFKKVQLTSERLKLDYAKSCKMVAETTEDEEIQTLLYRFSSSLNSGEPESEFLTREAQARSQAYDNDYVSRIETLKLWTDAYVSLILSSVLVIIMGIISTMIWKVETIFIMGLTIASVGTSTLGVWLIYLMSPRELVVLGQGGTKEQMLARRLFRLLAPFMGIVLLLMLTGTNLGVLMLVGGILILPIGYISFKDDKKVCGRDAEVGPFLGSLGGIAGAIGTTIREALSKLDLDAIIAMRREVQRLFTRLNSGIKSRLSWNIFVNETGSELANRSVGMFFDAVDLGGDPERAGHHSSLFAAKIAILRSKRKMVSSPFRWLSLCMHTAIIALLIFITEVIGTFSRLVGQAEANMPQVSGATTMKTFTSFNLEGLETMRGLVIPLVIVFTVANALAKILYNLGSTMLISGFCLLALPTIAQSLFSSLQI